MKKELGDVLWYISALARDLDIDLDTIAQMNLQKLKDRQERNQIQGSGDNR
jgi:NTP pyrophosphatase (non-canonical NTP hydrolase)